MGTNINKSVRFEKIIRITGFSILGLVAAAIFGFIFGYFVMLLWNWIMPGLFGLGSITFWQAFGIVVLARLIFGNLGHHHENHKYDKNRAYTWFMKWHTKDGEKTWKCYGDKKWRYYYEFWEKEGKKAFDKFVEDKKCEQE